MLPPLTLPTSLTSPSGGISTTLQARRYDTGEPVVLTLENGRIASIQPAWPPHTRGLSSGETAAAGTARWPFVAPGLLDLQINGYGGIWFSSSTLTADDIVRAVFPYLAYGVTRLCPTLITASQAAINQGLRSIAEACRQHDWLNEMIAGIHLEGPCISPLDGPRGAHPLEHVRSPDLAEFAHWQHLAEGRIRLVTLAPEVDGAVEFTRWLVSQRVAVAIGHTAASAEQIAAVVDAGATLSTHLGNGCAAQMHRHRNVIWPQLAEPRLTASLIVDGHHLPDEMVRAIVQAKTPRKIVLTCDASGWAGCPPGVYTNELGSCELLPEGRLVVAGQRELLAGSAQHTSACVARLMNVASIPLRTAIDLASRQPAELLGLRPARLREGEMAELFLFDWEPGESELRVRATLLHGRLVQGCSEFENHLRQGTSDTQIVPGQ